MSNSNSIPITSSSSRNKIFAEAYKSRKMLLDENGKMNEIRASNKIKSSTPLRDVDRSKIYHVKNKWWSKDPTLAGEGMSRTQKKLSKPENFTTVTKSRFEHTDISVSGDFCSDPSKATRMLMSNSYSDLTIPTRAADFNSGVEFRLSLRPNLY